MHPDKMLKALDRREGTEEDVKMGHKGKENVFPLQMIYSDQVDLISGSLAISKGC